MNNFFDSFNSPTGIEQAFDIYRLILLLLGAFFFGAITAAIQRGIKEQGWFGSGKKNRTKQTQEQIRALEDLANKANESK